MVVEVLVVTDLVVVTVVGLVATGWVVVAAGRADWVVLVDLVVELVVVVDTYLMCICS